MYIPLKCETSKQLIFKLSCLHWLIFNTHSHTAVCTDIWYLTFLETFGSLTTVVQVILTPEFNIFCHHVSVPLSKLTFQYWTLGSQKEELLAGVMWLYL